MKKPLVAFIMSVAIFFLWMGWKVGKDHEWMDKPTPYDYAYPEKEWYIAGYQPVTHTRRSGKATVTTVDMEPIWLTKATGKTLHETRLNHTVGYPYTAFDGICAGLVMGGLLTGLAAFIWHQSE